jgi:surface antigen
MAAFPVRLAAVALSVVLVAPVLPAAADPPAWSGAWPVRERFHRPGDGGDDVRVLYAPQGGAGTAFEDAATVPVARGLPYGFNRGTCDRGLLGGSPTQAPAVAGSVGRAMDEADRECLGAALEALPDDRSITWMAASGELFRVGVERTYIKGGVPCRDWRASTLLAGHQAHTFGTMCRRSDGQWVSAD